MARLKTLAKQLDFQTEREFCEWLMETFICGNRSSARNYWRKIHKDEKSVTIQYMRNTFQDYEVLEFLETVV